MRQNFFFFLVSSLIIFINVQPSFAENILELNIYQPSQLIARASIWPDWRVPSLLKRPGFRDDLIYPDWFEGAWDVNNKIEGDESEKPLLYSAKFIHNSSGELIADREYNTESYALSIKNSGFLSVKNDPNSPNRQFAKFTDDRYIETKIIGRLQEKINNNIFITDELILQILHTPELSRVSQVETLTKFIKCGTYENSEPQSNNLKICGEQFQAIYKQPGQNLNSLPIKTEKFKLILSKTNND